MRQEISVRHITLKLTLRNSENGVLRTYDEQFRLTEYEREVGKDTFRAQTLDRKGEPTSMSYVFDDLPRFELEWQQQARQHHAVWEKHTRDELSRAARKQQYEDKWKPIIDAAFENDDLAQQAIATAVEWYALDLDVLLKDAATYGTSKYAKIRKEIRPMISEAKSNTRGEYPEQYRTADDKEYFYTENIDDIAQHIARNAL